jgi:hypothetical protein
MTYIDLANITANNTLQGILYQINVTVGHGWFFTLVLLAFFIILMVGFANYPAADMFFASIFITTMLSGFFWLLDFVGIYIFAVCLVLTVIALLLSFLTR